MTRVEERISLVTAAWVARVVAAPVRVLVLCALATAASLYAIVGNLGLNADTEAMLSDDLPFRRVAAALEQVFPSPARTLLVLVESDSSELTRRAAEDLAAGLRAQPEQFESVFLPGGGEFFSEHGLLYLDVEELEDLSDRLATAQPFLVGFARDPTLASVADLLARAVDQAATQPEEVELELATDELSEELDAVLDGTQKELGWERWLMGEPESGKNYRRVLQVLPVLDFEQLQPAALPLRLLAETTASLRLAERGVEVRVTGDPALSAEEMDLVADQAALAGLASLLLVAVLLGVALRSVFVVISLIATLIAGLIWTAAFAALAIGHLNLVSVTFAVLFIGLGVDFGIHFSMRVLESVREGEQPEHALAGAARTTGTSLVLCAITTAIGFYAFLPTSYAGVAELGAISGTGMFLSLIATLTLLPALLALRPGALQAAARRRAARTSREAWLPTRRPKIVLGATAAAVVLALLALPGVRFDASPLGVRDPNAESVQAMRDLLESSRSSPWPIEFLAGDLDAARSLSQQLGALPEVDRTVTVLDFVPENQDEKLEILSDITLFLGALHSPSSVPASVERTGAALRRLEGALLRYERSASEPALAASAERLRRATERTLVRIEQAESAPEELQRIEAGMLGPLPALVAGLDVALSPGRVELDDLPLDLRARYMSADGQVRVQVFPTADLGDSAGLVEFVDAVRVLVPDASGSAVTIVESSRAIVGSLRWALGTATIAIGVLLLVMWRRIATTALVLAPLALAALLTTAGSVIVGPPFNFANVIVLPLLLGMGIDSGIHLVSRFEEGVTTDLLRTSTARAVLYSALTTAGSFGTLGLASHQGMASLGQLLTYGMIFTLLANLVVLPALLMTWRRTGGSA